MEGEEIGFSLMNEDQSAAEKEAAEISKQEYERFLQNEDEFIEALNMLLTHCDDVQGGDENA